MNEGLNKMPYFDGDESYLDAVMNDASGIVGADFFPSEWEEGLTAPELDESMEMDTKE